jgi:hypothetical protein
MRMCVDIQITSDELTCTSDEECTLAVGGGEVCSGGCACPGYPVNTAGAASIEEKLSTLSQDGCGGCPYEGQARCLGGQCTLCPNPEFMGIPQPPGCLDGGSGDSGLGGDSGNGDAQPGTDSGIVTDGGQECVDIDLSTYNQSCNVPSDCIAIFTGEVCVPSDCPCDQAFVNISEQARYDQAINSLPPDDCTCPTLGEAKCISGMCIGG